MNSFRPHFPGGLLARPEFIQVLVFAVGVHGIEEPVVAVSHELTFARQPLHRLPFEDALWAVKDRKSTRLNSSHTVISYAVFCLKKEKDTYELQPHSDDVYFVLVVKNIRKRQLYTVRSDDGVSRIGSHLEAYVLRDLYSWTEHV